MNIEWRPMSEADVRAGIIERLYIHDHGERWPGTSGSAWAGYIAKWPTRDNYSVLGWQRCSSGMPFEIDDIETIEEARAVLIAALCMD